MTSPPSRPSPRASDVADRQLAIADADLAALDDDVRLVDALEPRGHRPQLRLDVAAGGEDRVAHQHGRAAGRGLLVVRHDRGVAHDDRDPVERRAELVGRDLGEDRPRALAHVRTCRRRRRRCRRPAGGPSSRRGRSSGPTSARRRCPGRDPARLGSPQPISSAARRTASAQSPSAGVSQGMNASPRPGEVAQPELERVDAELAGRLVDVRLDRPDLLRVAEAAERGRGHGVREHAPGEDPDGRARGTARSTV